MKQAAAAFGVHLQYLEVRDLKDIETAFQETRKGRADGILVLTSPVTNSHRSQIIDLTLKNRLAAIYYTAEWVEAGGLLTYGANLIHLRGQNFERCQPGRVAGGAADEVRVCHQS